MSGVYTIQRLLDEVVTLPSLPEAVLRFQKLAADPNSSLREIGHAVSSDPAISLKALRLVNSAFYALGHKVTSVEHAASLLGMKVMKNLIYTATFFQTFQNGSATLLRHSVLCGAAMREITRHLGEVEGITEDEAFVFGLLHDVGIIMLDEHLPDDYEKVVAMGRDEQLTLCEAEHRVIGVNHAELGAQLAMNWGLSPLLINAIAGHHDLNACVLSDAKPLAARIAVANAMCDTIGIPSISGVGRSDSEAMWDAAGLNGRDMAAIVEAFFNAFDEADQMIHVAT